jgi:hypothetical protein
MAKAQLLVNCDPMSWSALSACDDEAWTPKALSFFRVVDVVLSPPACADIAPDLFDYANTLVAENPPCHGG